MNKATAKRNAIKRDAMNATTKKEQKLAARIAELEQDSDEAQELLDSVTNIWVIDLAEILQEERHNTQEGTTP